MSTSRFAERFGPRGNRTHALMSLELQYVVHKNKHDLLLTARAEASRGGDAPQHTLHMTKAEDLRVCALWSEHMSVTLLVDATRIFDATRDAMRLAVHSATPVRRSPEQLERSMPGVCWAQALLEHAKNHADGVRAVFVKRVRLAKRAAASRRCRARKNAASVMCQ